MADRQFKCYPYLLDGACSFRGKELANEVHYTNGGREYHYYECLNEGINSSGKQCKWCLYCDSKQNHWLLPRQRRTRRSEVKIINVGAR